jgi:ribokinase
VIGAINWDINLFVETFPKPGEERVVKRITRVPGGKAGNTAVAAARLLGPNQVAMLGGLGNDSIATEQAKILKDEGVDVSGLKFSDKVESGQAYIVIDANGQNIIHTYSGANVAITPEDLDDPKRRSLISNSMIVTIINPPYETALKLASEAKRLKKVVAWDPGVKSELGIEKVKNLLEKIDYLVANEFEMTNLTGTTNYDKAAAKLIANNGQLKVVTKLGAKGCVMYSKKERIESPPLDLASLGMKVVNTVGCGDAFLGALVAALSEDRPDSEALRWGNCAGGLKATRAETRGSPDRKTLLRHLK